ncbi:hypothetical protein RND71_022347 [Anisodus tanguticus]|uniref:DUF4283 domain-containing protein n=1 Tax=Anisodus tanguticus TaxID=243964 RepID=A0AAE1RYB4_9SOLA|nr:hypothetical protein RND71_022347 [Anisodus tanguticus]
MLMDLLLIWIWEILLYYPIFVLLDGNRMGVVLVQCTQSLAGETIHKDATTVLLSLYDSQDIPHHQTFGGSSVYTAWWKSESFRLGGPHISLPFEGVRVRGAHTVHHWWEFEVFRLGGPHTYRQTSMGSRLRGSAHTVHHWWESKGIRLGGPHIYLIVEGVRGRGTHTAHHRWEFEDFRLEGPHIYWIDIFTERDPKDSIVGGVHTDILWWTQRLEDHHIDCHGNPRVRHHATREIPRQNWYQLYTFSELLISDNRYRDYMILGEWYQNHLLTHHQCVVLVPRCAQSADDVTISGDGIHISDIQDNLRPAIFLYMSFYISRKIYPTCANRHQTHDRHQTERCSLQEIHSTFAHRHRSQYRVQPGSFYRIGEIRPTFAYRHQNYDRLQLTFSLGCTEKRSQLEGDFRLFRRKQQLALFRAPMAIAASGRPPPEVVQPPTTSPTIPTPLDYSKLFKPSVLNHHVFAAGGQNPSSGGDNTTPSQVPFKPITYLHGEPTIIFNKEEIELMINQQDLRFAVVGKFSYGWPEISSLRTSIPKQCELKGEVRIGLLCNRHVLIRCSLFEDYLTLMSKPNWNIQEKGTIFSMRTFKWSTWFDSEEETSLVVTWISLPRLPPTYFGEAQLFSIAAAAGRPLAIDVATKNKTRPSCARVKIEID